MQTDHQIPFYIDRNVTSDLPDEISQQELDLFMEKSAAAGLYYHGEPMRYCFAPIVFNPGAKKFFSGIVATISSICEKVTQRYQTSEEHRKLWELDELTKDLALLPKQYSAPIPIMRADIFLNPETNDFKFCEVNTDGSSSMNEDFLCTQLVSGSSAWFQLLEKDNAQPQELFEPFVDDILNIFCEWMQGKDAFNKPQVAIVDYPEDATPKEFIEFQKRFSNRGVDCVVVDINDLRFKNGSLLIGETKINVVYRRAVTNLIVDDLYSKGIDRLSKIDGSDCEGAAALVSAAMYNVAVVVGGFHTLLAHNKQLFEVLWDERTWKFLSSNEVDFIQAHVPKTFDFARTNNRLNIDNIYLDKNRWILKPKYGSSTIGVFAGIDCLDNESWIAICEECFNQGDYVIQEYCEQFSEPNIIPQDGSRKLSEFNYIIGLFNSCGKYVGTYVRGGKGAIIGSIRGSAVVASFHKM